MVFIGLLIRYLGVRVGSICGRYKLSRGKRCLGVVAMVVFFVFKQKTAYDIEYGLVGSEMCIRDSAKSVFQVHGVDANGRVLVRRQLRRSQLLCKRPTPCLLYTSDAADERSSVDLGGRRIIKKKNTQLSRDAAHCHITHTTSQHTESK